MIQFWTGNMPIVFFFYALTYFSLGLSLFLHTKKNHKFISSGYFWMLAIFGIAHSLVGWVRIFVPISIQGHIQVSYTTLHLLEVLTIGASFFFLLLFGANLLTYSLQYNWIKKIVYVVSIAWLFYIVCSYLSGSDSLETWTAESIAITRYFISFPGSFLTGLAFFYQAKQLKKNAFSTAVPYCRAAGIIFLLFSLISGLIVRPVSFWPGNVMNTVSFLTTTGIPVQLVSTVLAVGMVFTLNSISIIFDKELNQRIAEANKQREVMKQRERFGRDLHDGIIQLIYSSGLHLENIKFLLKEQGSINHESHVLLLQQIEEAQKKLDKTNTLLRSYIRNLRQNNQQSFSLNSLVDQVVQEFRTISLIDINVSMKSKDNVMLTAEQEHDLYHILQEALFNVVKHANAQHIRILIGEVERDGKVSLFIKICDDGKGINSEKASSTDHYGLENMRHRIFEHSGEFKMYTEAGKGTSLEIVFPLEEKK